MDGHYWLPLVFLGLLGLTMTVYVVLDGFDLGVGMLLPRAEKSEQGVMVSSIGPFWDANETWLVLGVGVLFVVFPKANTLILGELYLPATLMLFALMLRGAAFDFRVKSADPHRFWWDAAFVIGSSGAALAQGYMLGRFVTAFGNSVVDYLFAVLIMLCVPAVYVALAACWLLAKTEHALQDKARMWANQAWYPLVGCLVLISLATPYVSGSVFQRWFAWPNTLYLAPIPLLVAAALWRAKWLLQQPQTQHERIWQPFGCLVAALVLCALGLGISLFPYVVLGRLDVWQAAASVPAMVVTLIGVAVTVPMIAAYNIFAYWVFRGKAGVLSYHLTED